MRMTQELILKEGVLKVVITIKRRQTPMQYLMKIENFNRCAKRVWSLEGIDFLVVCIIKRFNVFEKDNFQ